jgi:hypothetical protein
MKIGIIHPVLDVIGGAEQTTLSLLNILNKTEYEVTLYTTTKNIQVPPKIKIKNLKIFPLPIGLKLQRILEIKELFNKAKNEDIFFISSGNLVLTNTKKIVIIYCHSTFESELKILERKNSGIFSIYHNYIKKQIKNNIELLEKSTIKLIANSNYTKEKLNELFGGKAKVIFPPVKLNNNIENLKKSGIITIARYSMEKNLEFNLDVIKELNISYKIFGNAEFSSQMNYYNHLLKQVESKQEIELFCNSKRELIEKYLNSSKIYFQSSKETFGISVIEGIMAGCIPIVPDNTANRETVPINELRYKENDKNDAKKKIESALRNDFDKYLLKLQLHAKTFSEENFQKNIINYLSEFEKKNRNNLK